MHDAMTMADQQMHDGMMMGGQQMPDMMTMAPTMILGLVFMIAVVAALITGIVWLVRNLAGDRDTTGRPRAIEQLEGRYARGEIDRDEFLQRRNDLERV